jgi:hypothetical protein
VVPPTNERGSAHPLPFLKQRLVVDDDAPEQTRTTSRPPRPARPAGAANQDARPAKTRRKPLRRLKARRGKPG